MERLNASIIEHGTTVDQVSLGRTGRLDRAFVEFTFCGGKDHSASGLMRKGKDF